MVGLEEYYDQRFIEDGLDTFRRKDAYKPFVGMIPKAGKLLDVGCGNGYLLKIAEENGLDPYGIDISREAVRLCSNLLSNGVVKQASATDIPVQNNEFDIITCLGTLEHIPTPEDALSEIKRVAKGDATILFLVPNKNFIFWKLNPFRDGTEQQEAYEILRTYDEWCALFEENGFTIHTTSKDPWHLKYTGIKKFIAWIVNRLIPKRLNYQFIYILKTKSPI